MTDIDDDAMQDLIIWLYSHENDIANAINDYGDLQLVFFEFCGREAEIKSAPSPVRY